MKHPIIKEILLGKTVDEAIQEHFSDLNWEEYATRNRLPDVIREIIRIGKSDLRFAVDVQSDSCQIIPLNADFDPQLDHYWEDEYNFAKTDEASNDCDNLNGIVEALYGTKRKKPKPKATKELFLKKKGNLCPYCLGTKIIVLDSDTWSDRDEMGCKKCGETWYRSYKTVVTGFRA